MSGKNTGPWKSNKTDAADKGGKGKSKTSPKPHATLSVECPSIETYNSSQEFGSMFTVNVATFQVQEVNTPTPLLGHMVLDTACQRTCCGEKWLSGQVERLRDRRLREARVSSSDLFQFGKGAAVTA